VYYLNNKMLNAQTISVSQKWKMWRDHKEERFKQMANDPSSMFEYFYLNNDIFQLIQEPDMLIYT
jgi:hypothetical protein